MNERETHGEPFPQVTAEQVWICLRLDELLEKHRKLNELKATDEEALAFLDNMVKIG